MDKPPPTATARVAGIVLVLLTLPLLSFCPAMAAEDLHTLHWSGSIFLEDPTVIPANTTLHVDPGTTISSADGSGAYIAVFGSIHVHGTDERPAEFQVNVTLHTPVARTNHIHNTTFDVPSGTALEVGSEAAAVVDSSTFRGGSTGLHVHLTGEDHTRTRPVEVRNTTFIGSADHDARAPGGAGLWVGGELGADRSHVLPLLVVLEDLQFQKNIVGLAAGGDAPSVTVSRAEFRGNDRAVVTDHAIVNLDVPRFQDNRVQVDAGSGGATVRVTGTELVTGKVVVQAPSIVQADTVAVQTHPLWLELSIALAAAFLALLWLVKFAASRLPWVVLQDRLTRGDVLDHDLRREIYEVVRSNPGIHMSGVAREVGGYGTARYHLLVLEDWDLVKSKMRGGQRRYYPCGVPEPHEEPTTRERVLHLVYTNPGIGQSEVARKLDCSRQLVSYHVGKLEDDGRVNAEFKGGLKRLHPTGGRD